MEITEEELIRLKFHQEDSCFHPFTCCGFDGCVRSEQENDGALNPTKDGWVCPCGKYKQEYKGFEKKHILKKDGNS